MKVITYICCGHPSEEFSFLLAKALAKHSYALEVGLPFSDPIADGPIIQRASSQALANKVNAQSVFALGQKLRSAGVKIPLYIMTYYNLVYSNGFAKFLSEMKKAGFNGLIIPDLPFGEDKEFRKIAAQAGISIINFIAPNTAAQRAKEIIDSSMDFIYLVSSLGTTGARSEVEEKSLEFVRRTRKIAGEEKKLFVGFGISNAKQAREFTQNGASGVIVGSKLIEIYSKSISDGKMDEIGAIAEIETFMSTFR